jgi:integrase
VIYAVGLYSVSLCRHREDQGSDPDALGRDDLLAFSADLSHLEAAGELSRSGRNFQLRRADQFLREARGMGLARSGGPLEGLPDDVVLRPGDRRRTNPDPDREGRGLPQVVLDQLLAPAALRALEATHGPDVRTMVELQAEVGRRTGELRGLRYDCLAFDEVPDESGQMRPAPVLIHDMPKIGVSNHRLPIDMHCAEIIQAQQARLRLRYPDTATSALAFVPAVSKNPRGVKACGIDFFERHLNTWIVGLAELLGPAGEPYRRCGITPYSFRHFVPAKSLCRDWLMEALSAGGLWPGHPRVVFGEGLRSAAHACLLDLVLLPRFRVLGHRTAPIDPRGDAGFDRLRLGVRGRAGVTALYDGGESVAA